MSEQLLTVTETAARLGISRSMVHHLIRRGLLTPLRLPPKGRSKGHKIYLRASEVEAVQWNRRKD